MNKDTIDNVGDVRQSILPTDTEIEEWMFHKIGKRETMSEKEYFIGMIMAKHIRDEWEASQQQLPVDKPAIDSALEKWEANLKENAKQQLPIDNIMPYCLDCEKPYSDFGLDMVLPDEHWLKIHPGKNGLLCAQCIVNRAAKIDGITGIYATITAPQKPMNNIRWIKSSERLPELDGGIFIVRNYKNDVLKMGFKESSPTKWHYIYGNADNISENVVNFKEDVVEWLEETQPGEQLCIVKK